VRLLLDTHVLIWWLEDPMLLTDKARLAIADPTHTVMVSAISFLEIALKEAKGKLKMPSDSEEKLADCRFGELPLTIAHATVLKDIPILHGDPFDRLLIAQAKAEKLTLVTRDRALSRYGIEMIVA